MDDKLFESIEGFLANPDRDIDDEKGVFERKEDITTLIEAFAVARGEKGFTEEETVKLVRWAESMIIGYTLLGLVLDGLALIDDPEGTFEDPVFSLSPLGKSVKFS